MRLPNSKAIKEIYQDQDGWWVILKEEYINSDMGGHVVNGENYKELYEAMKEVKRVYSMTIDELVAKPKDMTMDQWEKELKKRKQREKRVGILNDKIQECEDALDVLSDEVGSERWNKWNDSLQKYTQQRNALIEEK